jgi:hypothetical protein
MLQAILPVARVISRSSPQARYGKRAIATEGSPVSRSRVSWPLIISGFSCGWQARADPPKDIWQLSGDKQTIAMVKHGWSKQSRSASPFCAFSGHGVQACATHAIGCVGAEKDHGWRDFVRLHPWYAHHRARRTRGDRLLFGRSLSSCARDA